jgi:hypothetical protein
VVDWSALNSTVSGTFCDKSATWGAVTIYEVDTYAVIGEAILADCLADGIEAMKRGDTLTIDSVSYKVMAVHRDGSGWAKITMEKA